MITEGRAQVLVAQQFAHDTWLEPEEVAYPSGRQARKGRAIFPDGVSRRVYAGIPDTWFSIPAHARIHDRYVAGYVSVDDGLIACEQCEGTGIGCPNRGTGPGQCLFGLVDSPTRGALTFTPTTPKEDAV